MQLPRSCPTGQGNAVLLLCMLGMGGADMKSQGLMDAEA